MTLRYLAKEPFTIEIREQAIFDPDKLANALVKNGILKPIERVVIEEQDNPLMLEGKYIVHYMSKSELRYCLTQLGVAWDVTDTVSILKKKRDAYLARVKKERRGQDGKRE